MQNSRLCIKHAVLKATQGYKLPAMLIQLTTLSPPETSQSLKAHNPAYALCRLLLHIFYRFQFDLSNISSRAMSLLKL